MSEQSAQIVRIIDGLQQQFAVSRVVWWEDPLGEFSERVAWGLAGLLLLGAIGAGLLARYLGAPLAAWRGRPRAWVKVTGWPTRSVSQAATFCGLRSTSGSIWFTTPTAAAARISTTSRP